MPPVDYSHMKLGLLPATPGRPQLRLGNYLRAAPRYPMPFDYLRSLVVGLYNNDRFGVCGPCSVANGRRLTTWHLTGNLQKPTQEDVYDLYRRSGNPRFNPNLSSGDPRQQDQGVNMQQMLTQVARGGIGGVKALGFASVDVSKVNELMAATAIFGSIHFGISLQAAQQSQTNGGVWDHVPSAPWGGHAVMAGAGDSDSLDCITWAKRVQMRYRFITKQSMEAWVIIWPEHLHSKVFVEGMDVYRLAEDYQTLTGRRWPAVLPPKPVPVPPVPVPPTPGPTPTPTPTPVPGPTPIPDDPSALRRALDQLLDQLITSAAGNTFMQFVYTMVKLWVDSNIKTLQASGATMAFEPFSYPTTITKDDFFTAAGYYTGSSTLREAANASYKIQGYIQALTIGMPDLPPVAAERDIGGADASTPDESGAEAPAPEALPPSERQIGESSEATAEECFGPVGDVPECPEEAEGSSGPTVQMREFDYRYSTEEKVAALRQAGEAFEQHQTRVSAGSTVMGSLSWLKPFAPMIKQAVNDFISRAIDQLLA